MTSEEPDWSVAFATLRDDHEQHIVEDTDGEKSAEYRLPDQVRNEIRRGQRLLAKPHGTLSGTDGDPSEEEIKAMTTAIRAEWSERELRRRTGGKCDPVEAGAVRTWGTDERGGNVIVAAVSRVADSTSATSR